jgi:branched-chain amino acid transport system substrate-binding protein
MHCWPGALPFSKMEVQMNKLWKLLTILTTTVAFLSAFSAMADTKTVKVAIIEPMSGPIAGTGKAWADQVVVAFNQINAEGGVLDGRSIEPILMDNAGSVEKTNELLQRAFDEGINYVVLGIGSNHALATSSFIQRQNKRNPDRPMLYFNTSGGAKDLTNDKCSYWHFRWGVGADMSASALVNAMKRDPNVKRIYQLDMAYSLGKSFNEEAKTLIEKNLPNTEIVGSDLIQPFGKVQDFTPYILKLKESNADTVVTSSFSVDFVRFYKAMVEAGLDVKVYSTYGTIPEHMAAITPEDVAIVPIISVADFNPNDNKSEKFSKVYKEYMDSYNGSFFAERDIWMAGMFKKALEMAGEDDALKVAKALEELTYETAVGVVEFRDSDHQFTFPFTIVELTGEGNFDYFVDGKTTGIGMKTVAILEPNEAMMPTTCKMERP